MVAWTVETTVVDMLTDEFNSRLVSMLISLKLKVCTSHFKRGEKCGH
jgi:hypothetical protein